MARISQSDIQEAAKLELARRYFNDYISYVDPKYEHARHLLVLQNYLTKVEEGEIDRLMIFMPPRHGKSLTTSRLFPSWYLGRHPEDQIILASYASSLAEEHSYAVRAILEDHKWQSLFPYQISKTKRAKDNWMIEPGGAFRAVGVEGGIAGRGGDLVVIDDPFKNRKSAESPTYQKDVYNWYRADIYTRLAPGGKIVLMMTRWHKHDLAGMILEEGSDRWVIIEIPAICDSVEDVLNRNIGEALWPKRFPLEVLEETRGVLGNYDFTALFQQKPRLPGGNLVKREWFTTIKREHLFERRKQVRAWDLATTVNKSSDYTVGTLYGLTDDKFVVEDVFRFKAEWPDVRRTIIDTAIRDGRDVEILLEVVAFQTAAFQELELDLKHAGYSVIPRDVRGDKKVRFLPFTAQAEMGLIMIVDDAWNDLWLAEVCDFSGAKGDVDDQVDSVSMAHNYLLETSWGRETAIDFSRIYNGRNQLIN